MVWGEEVTRLHGLVEGQSFGGESGLKDAIEGEDGDGVSVRRGFERFNFLLATKQSRRR